MLWWIPIAVAGMAALGVLTVVASTAAGRYEGQHVLTDPHEEWDAWSAEQGRGSMILAEERHHEEWLPAPPVDPAPWLEQTMAELSPEALGGSEGDRGREPLGAPAELVLPAPGGWISGPCLDDPGPGDAAVEPPASSGPAQPSRWLAEQLDVLRAWSDWQQQKVRILA